MMKTNLTERGAQYKITKQYGISIRLEYIGVGDFNVRRNQWPVYVSSGNASPDVYWVS